MAARAARTSAPSAASLARAARRFLKDGQPDAASETLRQLLAAFPGNAQAARQLADIEARPPALPNPRDQAEEARLQMLVQAHRAGDFPAIIHAAGPLVEAFPDVALLRCLLGTALSETGAQNEAVEHLTRAEALRPDFADAPYGLGRAYQALGWHAEAVAAYGRALAADPDRADAWNSIGTVMMLEHDPASALAAFEKALEINPALVEALNNRGHMRQQLGDMEGAIADYEAALALDPTHVNIYFNIAHAMKLMGQKEAAKTCLWQVLKLDQGLAPAVRELADLVDGEEASRLRPIVRQLVASPRPETQMQGRYAAAYLDLSQSRPEEAVAELDRAGALLRDLKGYDIATDRKLFESIKDRFSTPCEPLAQGGEITPVFILGMPRSGTSLTEEILARHASVSAAGELDYLARALNRSGALDDPSRDRLEALRGLYLGGLAAHARDGAGLVTDKMPLNFRFIGHIAAALPEAKIIHLRRAPEAVCWSNFRHYFPADGMAYSSTQEDVAAFYGLYADLMAFWEEVLPGRIIHVDYAALTEAPEETVRSLIAALGLEWQDGLTDVAASGRGVKTASALQVKQGIYQGSSEAWRRYEPWLGPMMDGLRDTITGS